MQLGGHPRKTWPEFPSPPLSTTRDNKRCMTLSFRVICNIAMGNYNARFVCVCARVLASHSVISCLLVAPETAAARPSVHGISSRQERLDWLTISYSKVSSLTYRDWNWTATSGHCRWIPWQLYHQLSSEYQVYLAFVVFPIAPKQLLDEDFNFTQPLSPSYRLPAKTLRVVLQRKQQ